MTDKLMSINDAFSSSNGSITPKSDKNKESSFYGKQRLKPIIIILSTILLIIIFIVILISILSTRSSFSRRDKDDSGKIYCSIKCTYDIQSKEVNLLGREYLKDIDLDIFIDNEKIKYSKDYMFESLGIHNIEYKLYGQRINMDYMFKDVSSLITIELISEKETFITSMKNTFENCINLNKFESHNLNTSLVQSFHKLFYSTLLDTFKPDKFFDTSNALDLSYMFASSNLNSINFSFLRLNNAKNISNMFSNCHSLMDVYMDTPNIDSKNVEDISSMFYNCESIIYLNLSFLDTSKVVNISNMFKGICFISVVLSQD